MKSNVQVRKRQELELWEIATPSVEKRPNKGKSSGCGQVIPYRGKAVQSMKRRKARRRKAIFFRCLAVAMIVTLLALIFVVTGIVYRWVHDLRDKVEPPVITIDYLNVNPYSRPGLELNDVKSVFVHYTANPGTSAAQNRSYFANLEQTKERAASAHFIIGYEGEIIQCIPLEEQAYAVMTRNNDSVSIECCYVDENGQFTQETYDSLVHMLAWLVDEYDLNTEDILRHYDCGGKLCPIYYVENEGAWKQLLQDVETFGEQEAENFDLDKVEAGISL